MPMTDTLEKLFQVKSKNISSLHDTERVIFMTMCSDTSWEAHLVCQQSVSCSNTTHKLPLNQLGSDYVGRQFDSFEII